MDITTHPQRPSAAPVRMLRLADGVRLEVRPIEPHDRDRIAELLGQLSPHARYLRFLQAMPEIPEWAVASLCRGDDDAHAGLIAIDPGGRAAAVAQLFVVPGSPEDAELAVTISPAFQRRGLGAALVVQLARTARTRGIRALTYVASPSNRGAIALMRSLGAAASFEQGLIHGRVAVERVRPPRPASTHTAGPRRRAA